MTTKEILKAEKKLNFDSMNTFIENSNLQLKLIIDKPYMKSWKVSSNNEIVIITNYLKDIDNNTPNVNFVFIH